MPPIINNCVFCGASPTTKEHVYPRWTHKFITKLPGRYLSTQGTETKTSSDLKLLKGKGDIHDWQIKCVDERCNSGWMSQLEKRAMPILTPLLTSQATVLSVTDQRTVAAWAVLKAMVGEHETGMVSWSAIERDRMQRLRLPPNRDCAVWIARIDRGAWSPQWLCFSFPGFGRHRELIAPHKPRYRSSASTQIIGDLFIHVVHGPILRLLKKVNRTPLDDDAVRLIWPVGNSELQWPPAAIGEHESHRIATELYAAVSGGTKGVQGSW